MFDPAELASPSAPGRPGRRRRATAAGLLAASLAAALLAACGSEGTDESATAGAATGDAIRIMDTDAFTVPSLGSENPHFDASEARAKTINQAGGINGRPVEIIRCDTQADANRVADCARQAVAEKVVAVVGGLSENGNLAVPILERAGIPLVGSGVSDGPSGSAENVFPFNSVVAQFAAIPATFARMGCRKFGVMLPSLRQAEPALGAIRQYAPSSGSQLGTVARYALDQVDFAPMAAKALGAGEDCVLVFAPGPNQASAIVAVRERDPDVKVAALNVFLSDPILEALGERGDGVAVLAGLLPASADAPGTRLFRQDMDAHAKDSPRTDGAMAHWSALWLIERVMRERKVDDAAGLREALNDLTEYDMGGIMPPYTTTEPGPVPGAPRAFNTATALATVRDGGIVVEAGSDPFVDPFADR